MEKIINVPLTQEGTKTQEVIPAGFRGEHKATALVFTPDNDLVSLIRAAEDEGFEVVCRTDFALPSGEYFKGEERKVDQISEPFYLTAPMTASGLDGVVLLTLVKKSDGEMVSELFKAQLKVSFEDSGLPYTPCPAKEEPKQNPDLALFEEKVAEVTTLMEGKVAAVKGYADRASAHLMSTIELAERLDGETAELEEKLQNGEFDGKDADLSALANALKGSASGVDITVDDLSPLPHAVAVTLDKNLLLDCSFVDLVGVGYCRADKFFPLVKDASYTLKIETKSGNRPSMVVLAGPEWKAQNSPAYSFGEAEFYTFDAFHSSDHVALFINLPAEEVLSAEIIVSGEEDLANLPVSVTSDGETQVYYTDQKGEISFPAPSHLTVSAGKFHAVRLSYNKDLNKALSVHDKIGIPEKWVRIDTITLTDDTKSVFVEKEPDGTPYNFKKLRVIVTNPQVGSGNAYIAPTNANSNWTASYYLLSHMRAFADLWIEFGYLWVKTYSGLGDYSQFQNCGMPIPKDTIDHLRISGNGTILAGSTFEIWGVRNV